MNEDIMDENIAHESPVVGARREGFMERLVDRLGRSASSTTVYGEPVHNDGLTVIPVTRIRYAFGGGAGEGENNESGSGGGGAVQASPVGYIEMKNGEAQFRKIGDAAALVRTLVLGGVVGTLLIRSVARLVKNAKANHKDD